MTEGEISLVAAAAKELGCPFSANTELKSCTTFGVGGKCAAMIDLNGTEAAEKLTLLLRERGLPFFVIGRGSNIIASDSFIDRVFLRIGRAMSSISVSGNIICCQAGAALSEVCRAARDNGLTGLEFAYGIPASVGGAVYMNAGAYGGEIKDVILSVTAIDPDGKAAELSAEEMDMSYRHSLFSGGGYIITEARFKLEKGNKSEIAEKMERLTAGRREKQPLEYRSAGSTFKRPKGAYAAALIEQCGLKGFSVGGAMVSEKHSGFVINRGGATFEDIMAVIEHVKKTVKEKTGISLECEPEIIT